MRMRLRKSRYELETFKGHGVAGSANDSLCDELQGGWMGDRGRGDG